MSLIELSLQRFSSGMPQFAGDTMPEKLRNGAIEAGSILRKYIGDFELNPIQAEHDILKIDLWATRNDETLSEAMESSDTDLPSQIQLRLGSNEAQRFIVAGYINAAAGIGPWQSGAVASSASKQDLIGDFRITNQWAVDDANYRLYVFGSIVKMENEGKLKQFFEPPEGVDGFGVWPTVIWAIAVVLIFVAAFVLIYLYFNKRLTLNNKIMADICAKAYERGDQETIEKCLEISKELQEGDPFKFAIGEVGKVAMVAAIAYVGIRYGIPALMEHTKK